MYDIEALYEATDTAHALRLLQEHPEAHVIAGGSDVLVEIRGGKLAGCKLVSIQKVDELRGVVLLPDGTLRIGPLTSFSHLTKNELINRIIPVLGEAVDTAGGPQLRNIATIGGNICNGVTSADSASTLLAWDAVVEYTGPAGVRKLPLAAHYVKAGVVSLVAGELLTAIEISPASYLQCYGQYLKYAMRGAMDIATLGCSVNVRLSPDKQTVERLRVAFGVAGPVPLRAVAAEEAALGKPVSQDTIETAARAALQDVKPRTSWRATKELRLHLVQELTRRAFAQAIVRAGGTV